jgi:CRP/FNR family transcriptional regulator, cyclic AMP receptor protein
LNSRHSCASAYAIIYYVEDLFKSGKTSIYLRGDPIDVRSNIYYIKSGHVGLFSGQDSENLIFVSKGSEIFPMSQTGNSFISDANFEYRALSTTTVYFISQRQFDELAFSPEYARLSFQAAAGMLGTLFERIDSLSHYSVKDRIARRLLFIAERAGKPSGDKMIIDFPMPHSDLAAASNTSRESANRTMKQLEREGIITIKNQIVVINSMKKLQSLLDKETPKGYSAAKLVAAGLAAESLLLLNDHLSSLAG